jgi:2'-5' RNA ligase
MKKMRTFICIEISDNKIINEISDIQKEFKSLQGRIKSTELENIHITLKFLGDILENTAEEIIELLDEVKFEPFNLHLKGIGCFPNPKRPRIVWVGAEEGADKVRNIYDQINRKLSTFHFKKDRFRSHITISRVKFLDRRETPRFIKLLDQFKDKDLGTIKISSFQFKKSVLTSKGPIYTTLKEFKTE